MRHMWFCVALFALIQIIVSIAVAAQNDPTKKEGGLASASFAAIWSMFMVIAFTIHGAQIVFGAQSTEIGVGYMIGVAAMMVQLFFVLMCVFFVLATEANKMGYISYQSDAAFGSFCLLNMIIYLIWAIILSVHRRAVIAPPAAGEEAKQTSYEQYEDEGVNPEYRHEGDEAEL